jgi:hypothetical protein
LIPLYQTTSVSSSGGATHGSATLVGVNGWGVLFVVGAPLAATLVVSGALWRRGIRPGAGALAWTIAVLLAGLNVLALASIGVFVIPVTIGVLVACGIHGRKADRQASRPGFAS